MLEGEVAWPGAAEPALAALRAAGDGALAEGRRGGRRERIALVPRRELGPLGPLGPLASDSAPSAGPSLLAARWLAPVADALEGRHDASLADCLAGRERLLPFDEIAAPLLALTVDGAAVDDPAYPLVEKLLGDLDCPTAVPETLRTGLRAALDELPRPEPPRIARIGLGGDLMLGRGAGELLASGGPAALLGDLASLLGACDAFAANLEGALSRRGEPAAKSYTFRFSPALAPALRSAGFSALLLANNHALDWGREAFLDSLEALSGAGIAAVGAGRDEAEAYAPRRALAGGDAAAAGADLAWYGLGSYPRERNGWDGALAAAGPGRAGIARAEAGGAERLAAAFSAEALDLVLFHGGEEWSRAPDPATAALYRGLVDRGADLVAGSHPHLVQGMEFRGGKPIFWSLGNLVFAGMEGTGGGDQGLVAVLGYAGSRLAYLRVHPVDLSGLGARLGDEALVARFWAASRALAAEPPTAAP